MSGVIKHPDIINPYPNVREEPSDTIKELIELGGRVVWNPNITDSAFIYDLGLCDFLRKIPFMGSGNFALDVMVNSSSDLETTIYRQNVFSELMQDSDLMNSVDNLAGELCQLNHMADACGMAFSKNSKPVKFLMDFLINYFKFLNNIPDLSNAKTKALIDVNSFLNQVRESENFDRWSTCRDNISHIVKSQPEVVPDKNDYGAHVQVGEGDSSKKYLPREVVETIKEKLIPAVDYYLPQIKEVSALADPLDFYVSFVKYFDLVKKEGADICRPHLLPKEARKTDVRGARNPLLIKMLEDEERPLLLQGQRPDPGVVPNDIYYDSNKNLFVITGPNDGGKTTYGRTVGLTQLMAQTGLFILAESAEISFVDGIYTHFVKPDDVKRGYGTYRDELKRMKSILLENATPYSLVILDEPCKGTSHQEGVEQSLIILGGFYTLGCPTFFITHMHEVAKEVDKGRFSAAGNLSVGCFHDGEKMVYDYKVVHGASGKSYGKEIAVEVGLSSENINQVTSQRAEKRGYIHLLRK